MSRRGRKRKAGARYPSGDLRRPSVAEVAAAMPHRRGLPKAVQANQLGESELGRMCLRGEVTTEQAAAGELYRKEWQGYVAALCAPRAIGKAAGAKNRCEGCLGTSDEDFCLCELRRRKWDETATLLAPTGTTRVLVQVCLQDMALHKGLLWLLRLGLDLLARHYGLIGRAGVLEKSKSQTMQGPPAERPKARRP